MPDASEPSSTLDAPLVERARRGAPPTRPFGPRLLVCGFEEFPGLPFNPAGFIAATLSRAGWAPHAYNIDLVSVPTRWAEASRRIAGHMEREQTHGVLLVTADAALRDFRIGRTAVNALDARQEDGAGRRAGSSAVMENWPDRLDVTGPVDEMLTALRHEDLPVSGPADCGRYVCGEVLYDILAKRPETPAAHLVVPSASGFGAGGVLPLGRIQRGVQAAITAFAASIALRNRDTAPSRAIARLEARLSAFRDAPRPE